jgi:hypothetical protein
VGQLFDKNEFLMKKNGRQYVFPGDLKKKTKKISKSMIPNHQL